jgi:tetratricopeptide (TPR) repeat protein
MGFVAALVLLADVGLAATSAGRFDLATAARASPRPAECTQAAPGTPGSSWTRIRRPGIRAFCDRLALGYSLLARDPAGALAAADASSALLANRAEPLVLGARALAQLGKTEEAYRRFERARSLDSRSTEAPGALHDFAIAALRAHHPDVALALYRTLVPRAPLLGDASRRQRVYVEAAMLAMSVDPASLNEAVGYLSEARRQEGAPGFSDFVLGALALALDRQGRAEEAAGVASESPGPWRIDAIAESEEDGTMQSAPILLPDGEIHALVAILAGARDIDLARRRWEAYLDVRPDGSYAARAKEHLSRLRSVRR